MDSSEIKIKLLDGAMMPYYITSGASGLDLASYEDGVIESFDVKLVRTGIFFELPEGLEGQVRTRSGLALKNRIINSKQPWDI